MYVRRIVTEDSCTCTFHFEFFLPALYPSVLVSTCVFLRYRGTLSLPSEGPLMGSTEITYGMCKLIRRIHQIPYKVHEDLVL